MQYAAFVSYRHLTRDAACAAWLVEALETYQTPQELINQNNIPASVGLIFRDQNELASNADLTQEIKEALFASEHLIVVCSKDTPHSAWVRKEIALFKHWGREKNIHTILIGDNPQESFPPELYYWQIKGQDLDVSIEPVEPQGLSISPLQTQTEAEAKTLVRDQLLSRLLDCPLNQLRDRNLARLNKATTYRYFNRFVYRWGVPEGVGEFSADIVSKRAESYKFHYRQDRVVRVELINPFGYFAPDNPICQWDISYREDGKVEAIDKRNKHGDVKTRQVYSRDLTKVDFQDDADNADYQTAASMSYGVSDKNRQNLEDKRSNITRHLLKYNTAGFVIEKRYAKNSSNQPAKDIMGPYGVAYVKNELGLIIKEYYLDANYDRIALPTGIASVNNEYDLECNYISTAFYDIDSKPTLGPNQRLHRQNAKHDQYGNWIASTYFDTEGNPCENINGAHKHTITRDTNGLPKKHSAFDSSDTPTLFTDQTATISYTYDKRGNQIEQAYFDVDGNPCVNHQAFSRLLASYDSKNNMISQCFFDTNNKPCLILGGYARVNYEYDNHGNYKEVSFYGIDGNPTKETEQHGASRLSSSHDATGNINEVRYFDINNQLTISNHGYAVVQWEYDEKNNVTTAKYFDEQMMPLENTYGYASAKFEYDENNDNIAIYYFDKNNAPTNGANGAKSEMFYDQHGNLIEAKSYGVDGQIFLNEYGVSREVFEYDARGNNISWSVYHNDSPVLHQLVKFHKREEHFNSRGQVTQTSFFDTELKPTNFIFGFYAEIKSYNDYGRLIKEEYFDTNKAPCLNNKNYHCITFEYNRIGKVIQTQLLDTELKPINHIKGFSLAKRTYTDWGEIKETQYFDKDGNQLEHAELDEDETGHIWNVDSYL